MAWELEPIQLLQSSRSPWCLPLQKRWRKTLAATDAEQERLLYQHCSPVPSMSSMDPMHAVHQQWWCSHWMRSYDSLLHQQQSRGSQYGSRMRWENHPCHSCAMSYTHYKYVKYYSNLMNEPARFYHIHVARREARISNGKILYIYIYIREIIITSS